MIALTKGGFNRRKGEKNVRRREAIIKLIAEGCSNLEISAFLEISERTVQWYISKIYEERGFYGCGNSSRWKLIVAELTKAGDIHRPL